MIFSNYFGTPVGSKYAKKFARNFGISILILFALYGIWSLVTIPGSPDTKTQCLSLYKKIHENNKTPEMKLADSKAIESQKQLLSEYVKTDCPDFTDLDLMYKSYVGEDLK
jgi:hypothetical protein